MKWNGGGREKERVELKEISTGGKTVEDKANLAGRYWDNWKKKEKGRRKRTGDRPWKQYLYVWTDERRISIEDYTFYSGLIS